MNVTLSDGRQVPVTALGWAAEMRRLLLVMTVRPGFADVADLRRMLQFQPTHYMGQGWLMLAGKGREWLEAHEARLQPLVLSADLMAAIADDPLRPDDAVQARMMGAA